MSDLAPVFDALCEVMRANAAGMHVARSGADGMMVLAPWPHPAKPDTPMYFGGVKLGKNYVSYHLMPVYSHRRLLDMIPPELRRRMQGKSCFNFRRMDPPLFDALAQLTRAGAETYASPIKVEQGNCD